MKAPVSSLIFMSQSWHPLEAILSRYSFYPESSLLNVAHQ